MELEQEATQLGWVPQAQFKGDPEKWIDAETFVKRGKEILPILRKNNELLQSKIEVQLAENRRILEEHQEAMTAMKDLQRKSVKEAIERTRAELRGALKEAKESGDVDAELDVQEKLGEVTQQLKALEQVPQGVKTTSTPPAIDPETKAWIARNPEYETDPALEGLVMGLAQKIRRNPATSNLTGREFYNKLDELLEEYRPGKAKSPAKVEGSRGGGSSEGAVSGKGYSALPADAKAECDRDAARFVGENKVFKTKAEWQSHFAQLYFGEE